MCLLLFIGCAAHSSELYYINEAEVNLNHNEIIIGIPDDVNLTIMGVAIGRDSMKDVQGRFGRTILLPRKEHAPDRVCYLYEQNNASNVIVFEAGPLGGWNTITGFSLYDNSIGFQERDMCMDCSAWLTNVQTKGGIATGMHINDLTKIVGKPSRMSDNEVIYVYQGKRNMSQKELDNVALSWPEARQNPAFDVTSWMVAKFIKSRLVFYGAMKIESY
jgi:hypothetical protein